ncbi:MAG TPA: HAMP domain-containing sensor histidine kinase [Candidatus Desulfobacillus sp.]|nr:HAMP domain-containing sensor histidine kinase [Candidatus Desulfobacillus sp.]
MTSRLSLARRIVTSYVLMALVVAGLFSLTVVVAVDYTEDYYAAQYMGKQLDDFLAEIDAGKPFQLDQDQLLFIRGADGQPPLPDWLGEVAPGFREATRGGKEHHVLAREHDGMLFVLVQNQEEFEDRENTLRVIVVAAFFLSLAAAWALGRLMTRRVIAPVIQLADQVQRHEQLLTDAPPLAADYPPDEVGRLAAAFDAALGRLRQALERERFFTSDVSHELRTPLMVIASSCDLMLARGLADAGQETQVRRIRGACAEMQDLVETLLRLARASGEEIEEGEVALGQMAAEEVARLQPEAAARGLELRLVDEGSDDARHPASLLRAVLSNLLRNALHYTDRGFVRLVLRRGGFSVIDSGAGIPQDRHESVFRPFVRGDASRGDGLGLGLSLVQRICQRQGWRIRLDSRAEGGCEFRVDFLPG